MVLDVDEGEADHPRGIGASAKANSRNIQHPA